MPFSKRESTNTLDPVRCRAWGAAAAALGTTATVALVRLAGSPEAAAAWVPLRCPLRFVTGLPCPSCGLGHGLLALASGDVAAAWAAHPLAVVVPAALVVYAAGGRRLAGATTAARRLLARRSTAAVAIAAYVLFGVLRG